MFFSMSLILLFNWCFLPFFFLFRVAYFSSPFCPHFAHKAQLSKRSVSLQLQWLSKHTQSSCFIGQLLGGNLGPSIDFILWDNRHVWKEGKWGYEHIFLFWWAVSTYIQLLLPASSLEALVRGIWTGRRPVRWSRNRGRTLKTDGQASAGAAPKRKRRRPGNGNGRWVSGSVSRWSESRCYSRCSDYCGTEEEREHNEWGWHLNVFRNWFRFNMCKRGHYVVQVCNPRDPQWAMLHHNELSMAVFLEIWISKRHQEYKDIDVQGPKVKMWSRSEALPFPININLTGNIILEADHLLIFQSASIMPGLP